MPEDMMKQVRQHMVAFAETFGGGGPTAWNALTTVPDTIFSRASDTGVFVPKGMSLVGAYGQPFAFTAPRMRVNAPSLLQVGYPAIMPLAGALGESDPNFQSLLDRPIVFRNNEVVGVELISTGGAAGQATALLLFAEAPDPLPPGDAFWIHASDTTTASTANAWSVLQAIAWDTTLPEGTYVIIGFAHSCSNAIAARLIFPGAAYRPGTISTTGITSRTHAAFLEGRFGVLGSFAAFAPPGVEVLTSAPASNHDLYFRVVKVA